MPELPEVETTRITLLPHVVGQRVVEARVHDGRLRRPVDVTLLATATRQRVIVGVRRRAKYLLFDLEGGAVLMLHLGMSGRLGIVPASQKRVLHDHVELVLSNDTILRLNDARRFGSVDIFAGAAEALHPLLRHLGVEPLDATLFNGAMLYQITRAVTKPIKNFLMDSNRIVGVGNIYACESLHAAGIHPSRAAGRLSRVRCESLVAAIRDTLTRAIAAGGTTLRDFANVEGRAGYFAVDLKVYGRAGLSCLRCTRAIRRLVQAGRSTFFCPGCQR